MNQKIRKKIKRICCIGAGFVGGPTMAVIADKCKNLQINVVDKNSKRINQWNNDDLNKLPIFEPGLDKIIKRCRNKNLTFSTNVEEEISSADLVFISVNTPTKIKGLGAGKASDLKWVEACARQVAANAKGHTIVVEKSTLPVKTAEVIKNILESTNFEKEGSTNATFDVLSNPEFLAEGTAIKDLEYPDRVLIGGDCKDAIMALNEIYLNWIPQEKILHTNIWSSELAKLTANAFLAQRVSSINSIGALCEVTGANIREVSRAIGTDSRIGPKFLDAGPGFGGSCFKKDILNLVYLCQYYDLNEVATFWESVIELNNWHQSRIANLIVKKLFGTVSGKKIFILGFAFKENTNDTRESASIKICKDLLSEGAVLFINDPKVNPDQIENDLKIKETKSLLNEDVKNKSNNDGSWCFVNQVSCGFKGADAVVILTGWQEYQKIDWGNASKTMRRPSWVFDARSVISSKEITQHKLNFWQIGSGN
ncbi:nucleotide sugar dehydrogenase [Prochlorococcus marinus XMU1414]|uniref:UDP-glucose 6-dehydrogenase n=1 Tax=Prochlorococcus marinus XMU1424 TaxID=2774497 RepID=A0A9D9BYL9_PROMR|nr:nucleotide sugar dehydrogenase [Prochlorococcus marinus]MBO8228664.1 nucleotide sugar dehydrogenase [Prochlorococcus marinus XMU1414]MBW3046143.1 nucleotide sugar dehydrogenase [Prochlorococcus marinus str. MU1414]MCR8531565.1 nucleotide sugar dehydrogenase [Prochlorococcus marinus XMU1420]MCR8535294.1 nucleotide sugar dehydrogenase [Prochlorococcus marinus XMU1424]